MPSKKSQRSQASLTEILKEVRLLSQLSHPAVVRYYNTWVEEVPDVAGAKSDNSTDALTEETAGTTSAGIDIQFTTSTCGFDFMFSNAPIEFGYDDESDVGEVDGDSDEDDESSSSEDNVEPRSMSLAKTRRSSALRRPRFQRLYTTILYISMEYCEKRVSFPVHLKSALLMSLRPFAI